MLESRLLKNCSRIINPEYIKKFVNVWFYILSNSPYLIHYFGLCLPRLYFLYFGLLNMKLSKSNSEFALEGFTNLYVFQICRSKNNQIAIIICCKLVLQIWFFFKLTDVQKAIYGCKKQLSDFGTCYPHVR